MKKNIIFLLLTLLFFSCDDKETENTSRVTFYTNLTLKGEFTVVVKKGETYTEPGYEATENNKDVTDKVEVKGQVDTNKPGFYSLTYAVKNKDGFEKTAQRIVLVTPTNISKIDISGIYAGQREGKDVSPNACKISKLGDGVFLADDFFAGYYNLIRGFGKSYRLKTYFVLLNDNTYKSLSNSSPWGSWDIVNGKYNNETKTLTHKNVQKGYSFNVKLNK